MPDGRVANARQLCIESLGSPEALSEVCNDAVQIILDAHHARDHVVAADAMDLLFAASCSAAGTSVQVNEGEAIGPMGSSGRVGVLILGFAGSSLNLLRPLTRFYHKHWPVWKVVATAASGLTPEEGAGPAVAAQLDRIVAALADCRKVVVHCMSNNGQGLWAWLLHRKGGVLRGRVAAIVYDCAAARSDEKLSASERGAGAAAVQGSHNEQGGGRAPSALPSEEGSEEGSVGESDLSHMAHVICSTVLMPLMGQSRAEFRNPDGSSGSLTLLKDNLAIREALEASAKAYVERLANIDGPAARDSYFWVGRMRCDGEDLHTFDARASPPVPTLCLTSEADTVISPLAVADWRSFLLAKSGGWRDVRLETLGGTHCLLLQSSPADFYRHISKLITDAAVEQPEKPIVLGQPPPSAAASFAGCALAQALEPSGLAHLALIEGLAKLELDGCCDLFQTAGGRPAFLARLKEMGVSSLSERQKLANTIGKLIRTRDAGPGGVPIQ
jgi:pimeloyl-ACP methyl ester carboxylesterase